MQKQLLSLLILPGLMVGFVSAVPSVATASTPESVVRGPGGGVTVIPVNKSPDDAAHIQYAVDHAKPGDKITLGAGVFNFGDFDGVIVPKNLTIEGVWDGRNKMPATTIKGGMVPLAIGRKTPLPKPATVTVNGNSVYSITQDLYGQVFYPFLYPPYYDQTNMQPTSMHYDIHNEWVAVNVAVRQITFERAYGDAILAGGANGGAIERCRFVSLWPWSQEIELFNGEGTAIDYLNQAIQPLKFLFSGGVDQQLYHGTDLIRGNIEVKDNVMEGDFDELTLAVSQSNGDHLIAAFDPANPTAPPGNYSDYVLQDVATDRSATYNFKPATPPAVYWVKKGYTAAVGSWPPPLGTPVFVRRGITYGVEAVWTESTLNMRHNTFHNVMIDSVFLENGAMGHPFLANVEDNSIVTDIPRLAYPYAWPIGAYDFPWATLNGDPWSPQPGSSINVKNNDITNLTKDMLDFQGNIEIGVLGKATVENNRLKLASGMGILFNSNGPDLGDNQVAKNNTIAGTAEFGFLSYPGSNADQFVDNHLEKLTVWGDGTIFWDTDGNPHMIPPSKGLLMSDNNKVKGVGPVTPADIVVNCGMNNKIEKMIVQPCPAATLAPTRQAQPNSLLRQKMLLKKLFK